MCDEADFSVRPARRDDLPGVLAVQRDAFGRVAAGLGIPVDRLPPLVETLSEMQALFDGGVTFFVAVDADASVVGSVRATRRAEAVEVGRLVVADAWTRRGVATALMDALEAAHPDAECFELFTGADARVPLALYHRRGYAETRRESTPATELVWLEKRPRPLERENP